MRLLIFGLAIALTIASIPAAALGQMAARQSPKTPWQEVVVTVTDQPDENFHNARQDFLQGEKKDAAVEIRKGVEFLKLDVSHATGKEKASPSASFRELERLAKGGEDGTMTSIKELDRGLRRAEYRMARHQCKKASGFMRWKGPKKAGHDLKAAALNREHAAKRVGLELETEGQAAIEGERRVADKLIEGAETATTGVERAVKRLGEEMQEVEKGIEAGR